MAECRAVSKVSGSVQVSLCAGTLEVALGTELRFSRRTAGGAAIPQPRLHRHPAPAAERR